MLSTNVLESEYMSLADGVGIVPKKFRNRGYDKLEFGPGEGGLGDREPHRKVDAGDMAAFLAAVAAGADPQEYAKQALASKSTGRVRGQKGASA
jgi:hypothetical protein